MPACGYRVSRMNHRAYAASITEIKTDISKATFTNHKRTKNAQLRAGMASGSSFQPVIIFQGVATLKLVPCWQSIHIPTSRRCPCNRCSSGTRISPHVLRWSPMPRCSRIPCRVRAAKATVAVHGYRRARP